MSAALIVITDATMAVYDRRPGRDRDERGAPGLPCVLALGVDDEFLAAFNAGRPALAASPRGERAAEGGACAGEVVGAPHRGRE